MHRKAEGAEIFCLFNETNVSGIFQVYLPDSNGYLLDLQNGRLQRFNADNGILHLTLAVGETAVILLTDEVFEAEDRKNLSRKTEFSNEFTFSKDIELGCDKNGFYNIKHSDKSVPVTLGDWSCLIGSEYSGSCVYETTFTFPDDMAGK